MGVREKGYDAPEGLVKLKPAPFCWINFTHNGKLNEPPRRKRRGTDPLVIRESPKTKGLDEAIRILEEIKRSLSSINPRSKAIVDRSEKA